MKTLTLIQSLTEKETMEFITVINSHKRESLKKAFHFLNDWPNPELEPEKRVLFKAIFNEKFTKSKDYLLRNELRILNTELENFLIEKAWQQDLKTYPYKREGWKIQMLCERGLMDLAQSEFTKAFKTLMIMITSNLRCGLFTLSAGSASKMLQIALKLLAS